MSETSVRYLLERPPSPGSRVVLRSETVVWSEARALMILNASGVRTILADWNLDSYELTPDGRFLLALGDDSKRATVWETSSGKRLLDFTGDENRRQSLRGGLAQLDGRLFAFFAKWNQPVSIVALPEGAEAGWISTTGMMWFHVLRIFNLDEHWLAVHGYHDGEPRDTIVALPFRSCLADPMALYTALIENSSVQEWGGRAAVGPAGPGKAVFFRDPDVDEDEPPDDPNTAFHGLVFRELDTRAVTQRIEYKGQVADAATLGANADHAAIEVRGHVEVVSRSSGEITIVEAIALDPYRMEVASFEGNALRIVGL